MGDCNCGNSSKLDKLNIVNPKKFGRCKFCMYSTSILAIICWSIYFYILDNPDQHLVSSIVLAIAFINSVLFIIHMGVLVLRKIEKTEPLLQ